MGGPFLPVTEGTSAETCVGTPFTASDSDRQDVLTDSLSGADSFLFSEATSAGQTSIGAGKRVILDPRHLRTMPACWRVLVRLYSKLPVAVSHFVNCRSRTVTVNLP